MHDVQLTAPFYLGVTEVTYAQWGRVMNEHTPVGKENHPVAGISWEKAVLFCQRLNELPAERKEGRTYRLPTEAEWEYACRAGTATAFCFGDNSLMLKACGWFLDNSQGHTHPVGQLMPNAWGFHDMHGNVWEWCHDWFAGYSDNKALDPRGELVGHRRVSRGGGNFSPAADCCSAHRERFVPTDSYDCLGVRIAMNVLGETDIRLPVVPEDQPDQQIPPEKTPVILHNSIGIEFTEIDPGQFAMGDTQKPDEDCRPHQVVITRPFFISIYEVTNEQWERVLQKAPPGKDLRPDVPVAGVTWKEALEFCEELSKRNDEMKSGHIYRLPTEAEWEYACRAGTNTRYSFGNNENVLDFYGWHSGNAANNRHPVGLKDPNTWGLYDMHGNASELCSDFWTKYPKGLTRDPKCGPRGDNVARGGSWADDAKNCISARRDRKKPGESLEGILGFRIAVDKAKPQQPLE